MNHETCVMKPINVCVYTAFKGVISSVKGELTIIINY